MYAYVKYIVFMKNKKRLICNGKLRNIKVEFQNNIDMYLR